MWGAEVRARRTTLTASDLSNGAGRLDLAAASKDDNTLSWFENLGSGQFSTKKIITNQALGAYSLIAADVDGDGVQNKLI